MAGLLSSAAKAGVKANATNAGLLSPGIRAFHGSPHDFDRFSTGSIGTGEGNQAYGHGLYFAESEDVARNYRDSLTKLRKDGTTPAPKDSIADSFEKEYGLSEYESFNNTTLDDVIETIQDDAVETSADGNGNVRYEFSDGSGYLITKDGKVTPSGEVAGRMYEVNIDADPKDLLDWDKPLLEQPALLSKIDNRYGDHEIVLAQLGVDIRSNPTGMDLADALNMRRGDSSGPPRLLQEIGIKGVKYADAFTRHKSPDKQSKNFVIFDDRLIDISRKYGVTIPVAAAMLAQTEDAEAGFLTTPANLIRIGMLKPQSAENPSAVKSAMTKYDKAMRDNKAFRFREKLRADVENQTQSIDIGKRNILDVADLVGKVGVPVAGDTSVTGKILETIGGLNLDSPVGVEGGSNFGLRYKPRGFGWASMQDAAKKKQNNFQLAADETGMQPVGIFNAMGRDSVAFSTPPAETMLQQALALPIKKSDIKAFDDELKKLRPNWVGLNHPGAMDQIMGRGAYPQKGAGKLRSAFVEEMSKARHRDVGFPIKEDVYSEILQPEIADLPIGSSGFSMFDAQPEASLISGSPHQSYDTVIPGNYIGGLDQSVPARVMFPKTFADLDQRTNKAGELFTESQKTGSLVMNPKLYEVFDDQWADSVYKYQQEQAKKQRGAANPAALAATAATGAGLLGAGQVEGGVDKIAGIADAAANAASGMVAPILSAPGAVARYLGDRYVPGVDFSAEDIARERQNTEQFFDYQPRTELGQQYSDQGMQALGGLLAPVVDASQGSNIIDLLKSGYNKMGKKEKELTKALLDMSPI